MKELTIAILLFATPAAVLISASAMAQDYENNRQSYDRGYGDGEIGRNEAPGSNNSYKQGYINGESDSEESDRRMEQHQ